MVWADEVGELARSRGAALVGYAVLLTGSVEDAEDVVQEALVRSYAQRPRADLHVSEAYLRRVVLNVYLDQHRRRALWRRRRHLVAERDEVARGLGEVSADRLDVRAALLRLSPRQRACVVLRFFEDMTVPALAAELGIGAGTAKRYLSDALRVLQTELGPIKESERPDTDGVEWISEGGTHERLAR